MIEVNHSRARSLNKAAALIKGRELRNCVEHIISCAEVNADQTITDKDAAPEDWEYIFTVHLSCEPNSKAVLSWFTKRGIAY
jgi:hypothetical protein